MPLSSALNHRSNEHRRGFRPKAANKNLDFKGRSWACPSIRLLALRWLLAYSNFSIPTFLTFGFQILSGIQAGAPAGFFTCTLSPEKT